MSFNVLLVGAGQLGSRYLQGLSQVKYHLNIYVVDPKLNALALARSRFFEINQNAQNHYILFESNLNSIPPNIDLAIISTTAVVRLPLVKNIAENEISVAYWVLEKILTQSTEDLDQLISALQESSAAWVNTPRRMMPWYQNIRNSLPEAKPCQAFLELPGLACNSVHFLDLIAWLTTEKLVSVDTSELGSCWIKSKRSGFFEITGLLKAKFSGGSELILKSSNDEEPSILSITTSEGEWLVDEVKGKALGPCGTTILGRCEYQSEITERLVDSILKTKNCELPSLEESSQIHRMMLNAFLENWNCVNRCNDTSVPIT
jgi:hypothetical protein